MAIRVEEMFDDDFVDWAGEAVRRTMDKGRRKGYRGWHDKRLCTDFKLLEMANKNIAQYKNTIDDPEAEHLMDAAVLLLMVANRNRNSEYKLTRGMNRPNLQAEHGRMLQFVKDLTDPDVSLIVEKHQYSEKPFCSMCSSMIDKTKNGDGHDDWCLISSALELIKEIEEKPDGIQ